MNVTQIHSQPTAIHAMHGPCIRTCIHHSPHHYLFVGYQTTAHKQSILQVRITGTTAAGAPISTMPNPNHPTPKPYYPKEQHSNACHHKLISAPPHGTQLNPSSPLTQPASIALYHFLHASRKHATTLTHAPTCCAFLPHRAKTSS